jgi:hypothetical protein
MNYRVSDGIIELECPECGGLMSDSVDKVLSIGAENLICSSCASEYEEEAETKGYSLFNTQVKEYLITAVVMTTIGVVLGAIQIGPEWLMLFLGLGGAFLGVTVLGLHLTYYAHVNRKWWAAGLGLFLLWRVASAVAPGTLAWISYFTS